MLHLEQEQNGHYLFTISSRHVGSRIPGFRATPWMEGSNLKAGSHKMEERKGRMGFSNAVPCCFGVVSIIRNQSGVVISFSSVSFLGSLD